MKRSYIRCPCEKCIVLAICKGKTKLKCPFLYKYMRAGIKQHEITHPKEKYRIKKLEIIFKRKLDTYIITNILDKNPILILWWRKLVIKKGSR